MAMPGVSSELNHSFEIQACGRIRSPFWPSSTCKSSRHAWSHVPPRVTPRSLRRTWRSFSSGNLAQANLRAMVFQDLKNDHLSYPPNMKDDQYLRGKLANIN